MQTLSKTQDRKILFISNRTVDFDAVTKNLKQTMGQSCRLVRCSNAEKLPGMLKSPAHGFDVILLDLGIISPETPLENFRTVKLLVGKTPLIVMSEQQENELVLTVIGEGAANNITKGQLVADPYRIRDAIEMALVQTNASSKIKHDNSDALKRLGKRDAVHLGNIKTRDKARIQKSDADHQCAMTEKNDIINWLSGGYSVKPT